MFSFVKNDNGGNFPIIKIKPAAAGTYEVGIALIADSETGYVKAAAATTKPEFICACQGVAAAGDEIAVNPVYEGQEWATVFSADGSALKAGAKVTLGSDAKTVTATTTNGVAILTQDGGASGASVIVKF